MATEKWFAGTVGLTWATVTITVDSVVNGNAIASSALDNSSNLDMFADLSISLGSITPTGVPYIGVYVYPLNQDGSTYGDGRFGSSAAGPPPANYLVGMIGLVASAGVQVGMARGILLPPGSFKFVLYNQSGVTLAGSSNTVKWRTYDRSI
jgi:hypothetical protein